MVGLSEEDIERIQAFANTPRYQRTPSGLMPDGEDEDEDEPEAERAERAAKSDSRLADDPSRSTR